MLCFVLCWFHWVCSISPGNRNPLGDTNVCGGEGLVEEQSWSLWWKRLSPIKCQMSTGTFPSIVTSALQMPVCPDPRGPVDLRGIPHPSPGQLSWEPEGRVLSTSGMSFWCKGLCFPCWVARALYLLGICRAKDHCQSMGIETQKRLFLLTL